MLLTGVWQRTTSGALGRIAEATVSLDDVTAIALTDGV